MSKINLIPEVRRQKLKLQQVNKTVTSLAVLLGIILAAVIIGLSVYAGIIKAQTNSLDGKIEKVQDSLDTMKDLEATVLNLETGLTDIKAIIAGAKDWGNLFSLLERYTPGDIQITNFTVNGSSVTMSLKGKSVEAIDRFIASFSAAKDDNDQNCFSNVVVNGYTKKGATEVVFSAALDLNEDAVW